MNGAGNGNPNVEFSPDVSAVDLVAVGGTAYVTWGYREGSVAVTYAPNFMEITDKHRTYKRCEARDAHSAQVSHIVFCDKTLSFISGAWDGTVKLWSADPLNLLWESGKSENAAVGDACMRVAYDSLSGTIVAAMANGTIKVWTGLVVHPNRPSDAPSLHPSWAEVVQPLGQPSNKLPWEADPVTLSVSVSSQHISILYHANKDTHINRIVVPRTTEGRLGEMGRTLLADGPLGALTALTLSNATSVDAKGPTYPMFASSAPISSPLAAFAATLQDPAPATETSFVAAGDILGRVCIWDLDQPADVGPQGIPEVKSSKRFQAHDDGAVAAISLSPYVWATGRYALCVAGSGQGINISFSLALVAQYASGILSRSRCSERLRPHVLALSPGLPGPKWSKLLLTEGRTSCLQALVHGYCIGNREACSRL